MQRLTSIWFNLSDVLAKFLLAFSLVGVVAYPFVGPVYARMHQQPITTADIVGTCLLWLVVAAGAYAIIRRKVVGLLLILAPAFWSAISGQLAFALGLALVLSVVFATPFLFVLLQARSAATSKPAV